MNTGLWIKKHPYSFIGKKVVLNDSSYIGGNPLEIKDYTAFKGFLSTRGNANITFGSNCMIGNNLFIIASYKPVSQDYFKGLILLKNIKKEGPVYIGNNVQIGDDVIILPGVSVGDGAVIKNRSVVADNIRSIAKFPSRLFKTNKIVLNNARFNNFLKEGWGYLESGGRWVVDNQAGFMFNSQKLISPITLNLKGFSYIKPQKIVISVNDKKIGTVKLNNFFNNYKIVIKNLNKGVNYFKITFQHFSRPSEIDKKSNDARKLYCFFEEISLS